MRNQRRRGLALAMVPVVGLSACGNSQAPFTGEQIQKAVSDMKAICKPN